MEQFDFNLREDRCGPKPARAAGDRQRISDLTPGQEVREVYLVASKELRLTKAGKPYLRLRITDCSGSVDCMVWENADVVSNGFDVGDVVEVTGVVTEYEGRPQLEASMVIPAQLGSFRPQDFLPSSSRDIDELLGYLKFHIDSVYDRHCALLLKAIFEDEEFLSRFCLAPAAKQFHHAYLGGLLEHTVSVATLCESLVQLYPRVNHDLLITVALLHDIGKVFELTYDTNIDYSEQGRFLGHVLMGVTFVHDKIKEIEKFPQEKADHILHAIASHHGELEWGSPKRPKTLEALILHHVDNLDAKVKGFLEIVEGSQDARWTDMRNLFRRPLHVPRAFFQEEDFLPPHEDDLAGDV